MPTPKQIAALKYLISNSNNGNRTIKRILVFLIDSSEGLTLPVSMTFTDGMNGYSGGEIDCAMLDLKAMTSVNGVTHLDELMFLAGAELIFSCHYGHYEGDKFSSEGQFPKGCNAPGHENDREGMPLRYTIWLSKKPYGRSGKGKLLETPSLEELSKIDLRKSGLYPILERRCA